ncbi:hypothetical protein ACHAAC_09785 [Aeromicrobium sp. CF4.19]|uniref:hypothetical protein n=1 Tax=Aeromicrobium sp. CF4.19 TaxID=3373082 RepID=UPI003EE67F65
MSVITTLREFLGMDAATVLAGYELSSRGVRLPACEVCGAVVAYETQQAHLDWHARRR